MRFDDLSNDAKLEFAAKILDDDDFETYEELLAKRQRKTLSASDKTFFTKLSIEVNEAFEAQAAEAPANSDSAELLDGLPLTREYAISDKETVVATLEKIANKDIKTATTVDILFNGRDQELLTPDEYQSLLQSMRTYAEKGERPQREVAVGFRKDGMIYVVNGSNRRCACIDGGFDYYIYVIGEALTFVQAKHLNDSHEENPKTALDNGAWLASVWDKQLADSLKADPNNPLSQGEFAEKMNSSTKVIFNQIKASKADKQLRSIALKQRSLSTRDIQKLINLDRQLSELSDEKKSALLKEWSNDFAPSETISLFAHINKKAKDVKKSEPQTKENVWQSKSDKTITLTPSKKKGSYMFTGLTEDNLIELIELLDQHF